MNIAKFLYAALAGLSALGASFALGAADAPEPGSAAPPSAIASTPLSALSADAVSVSPRYTFSFPMDSSGQRPRGGSTRGAPVTLDLEPSAAWKTLREPGLTPQERDRRAILAMAGTFRSTFDFLEVLTYVAPAKPLAPYQSWGTEKVYVDRNQPAFLSLVHILEMRIVGADGKLSEPFVTKHWRQDWRYEPASIIEYKGNDRWQSRPLPDAERRGAWVQTVYQVDESPRYASAGRWQHTAAFSTWISGNTWRPLPRREWSVRGDYQVLEGSNRHTVGPTGWTQEENNLKTVLTEQRQTDAARPFLGREYGISRYERLVGADFEQADRYYERTRGFWDQVRAEWSAAFAGHGAITLRGPVDKLGLFMPLFERADKIYAGSVTPPAEDSAAIKAALTAMGVYQ